MTKDTSDGLHKPGDFTSGLVFLAMVFNLRFVGSFMYYNVSPPTHTQSICLEVGPPRLTGILTAGVPLESRSDFHLNLCMVLQCHTLAYFS